jgi:hypothetical protein
MWREQLLCVSLLVIVPCHYSQAQKAKAVSKEAKKTEGANETLVVRRNNLLMDLRLLDAEAAKIDQAFARAVAKLEIADAAWTIEQEWAKKLLREAYELTLPEREEERESMRHRPPDAPGPEGPDVKEISRTGIRSKIIAIASRDQAFVTELREYVKQQLGRIGESEVYASLVKQAMQAGNLKEVNTYALGYMEVDPGSVGIGDTLLALGRTEREAADRLVIQYIEQMRKLSPSRVLLSHVHFNLLNAVLPNPFYLERGRGIIGGQEAIKATLQYLIESTLQLERREPGASRGFSRNIMSLWHPIQQYAPELMGPFSELEQIWRAQGLQVPIPAMGEAERYKANRESLAKTASETRKPEDLQTAIRRAVSSKDFAAARKLLDLVPKGNLHQTLAEEIDYAEAHELVRKGEVTEAESIARRLSKSGAILGVYPVIIQACIAKKDNYCARSLMAEASKRLKLAPKKVDVPRGLAELANAIAPIDEALALETLEDAVYEANRSSHDAQYGSAGFKRDAFVLLAAKHEARVRQLADSLKDHFQRVVTLAAIHQAKAKELAKESDQEAAKAQS